MASLKFCPQSLGIGLSRACATERKLVLQPLVSRYASPISRYV
ncbi:hypothetical protein [Wolbachia endosymbiont (group A) of Volucella inflata]|nr:hypothetical protein [Wolbachia endosymbiont (group A) of Volucella inflata]